MTMDEAGDIANADVHVANGAIVAVGQNLKAPGVSVIDGQGMIVLPGLVETHWHMWNTLLRSMSGDKPDLGYFRSTAMLGQKFLADDMYQGTRLACAEAINNGITHVHDWCHNIRGPEYADADLKALRGHRSCRSDTVPRRLGKTFARWPADAGSRLARAGWQQCGERHPAGYLHRRDRRCAKTWASHLGPRQRLAPGHRPDRRHRQGRASEQGHAAHPRQQGQRRRDQGGGRRRRLDQHFALYRAAHRLRPATDDKIP
jgi:hypothetical protein